MNIPLITPDSVSFFKLIGFIVVMMVLTGFMEIIFRESKEGDK